MHCRLAAATLGLALAVVAEDCAGGCEAADGSGSGNAADDGDGGTGGDAGTSGCPATRSRGAAGLGGRFGGSKRGAAFSLAIDRAHINELSGSGDGGRRVYGTGDFDAVADFLLKTGSL